LTSALFDVLFKAFDLLCALSMRNAEKISSGGPWKVGGGRVGE